MHTPELPCLKKQQLLQTIILASTFHGIGAFRKIRPLKSCLLLWVWCWERHVFVSIKQSWFREWSNIFSSNIYSTYPIWEAKGCVMSPTRNPPLSNRFFVFRSSRRVCVLGISMDVSLVKLLDPSLWDLWVCCLLDLTSPWSHASTQLQNLRVPCRAVVVDQFAEQRTKDVSNMATAPRLRNG